MFFNVLNNKKKSEKQKRAPESSLLRDKLRAILIFFYHLCKYTSMFNKLILSYYFKVERK